MSEADSEVLDLGDRVRAACGLGGVLRPKVRRGTPGVVVGRADDGRLIVHFTTGSTWHTDAAHLIPQPPGRDKRRRRKRKPHLPQEPHPATVDVPNREPASGCERGASGL